MTELTSFKSFAAYLEASFWSKSRPCPNDIDQAIIIGDGGDGCGGGGGGIFLIFYFKYNWWFIHVS